MRPSRSSPRITRAVGESLDISGRYILTSLPDMSSAIVVRDLRKSYGGVEALRGIDFEVGRKRGVRAPRPQRRREDDHGRDPGGLPPPGRRHGGGSGLRPLHRRRRLPRADRRRPAAVRAGSGAHGARGAPAFRGLLRAPTPRRRGDRPHRTGGKARRAREDALRRPGSAASTWGSPSSGIRRWSSSTSRRRASTRLRAGRPGRRSARCARSGRRYF